MSRTLRAALNESNPNKLPVGGHDVLIGSALGLTPAYFEGAVAADILTLPEEAKAAAPLLVFARTGGTTGYKVPTDPETVPLAGEVSITPTGDLIFAAADAVTTVEATYAPIEGDIITEQVDVAASVATLLFARRARMLLAVTVDVGVVLGAKLIVPRGTAAPALGEVALDAAGTGVVFNAGDVVAGRATIRYIAAPGVGVGVTLSLRARLQTQVLY